MIDTGSCGIHAKAEHKFHIIVVVEKMARGYRYQIGYHGADFIVVKADSVFYRTEALECAVVNRRLKACDA